MSWAHHFARRLGFWGLPTCPIASRDGAGPANSCVARGQLVRGAAGRVALGRAALLLGAAACACGGDDEAPTSRYRDVGEFCVTSRADGGPSFSLVVGYSDRCLGCQPRRASCRATLTDVSIELTSLVELRESSGVDCLGYCLASRATCELGPVPAGDYQVTFAGSSDTAALPLEASIPLFGEHPCDYEPHFFAPDGW